MTEKTYFGLPVVVSDGTQFVRFSDIKALPFFEFWQASARGSTMRIDGPDTLVFLTDWKLFSQLFIETGRHRYQA